MKTLDEVIEELQYWYTCDEYPEGFYDDEVTRDALHYLEEYQKKQKTLEIRAAEYKRGFEQLGVEKERYQEAVKNCEEAENKYRMTNDALDAQRLQMMWVDKHFAFEEQNDPLTWDELKTMIGKPIWVEESNGDTKGWLLILRTNFDVINCTTKHGNSFYLYKSSYGERWQAYRKERNENLR